MLPVGDSPIVSLPGLEQKKENRKKKGTAMIEPEHRQLEKIIERKFQVRVVGVHVNVCIAVSVCVCVCAHENEVSPVHFCPKLRRLTSCSVTSLFTIWTAHTRWINICT